MGMTWKRDDSTELDHRLQLLVSSRQLDEVKRRAKASGVSAAELIRRWIADGLSR